MNIVNTITLTANQTFLTKVVNGLLVIEILEETILQTSTPSIVKPVKSKRVLPNISTKPKSTEVQFEVSFASIGDGFYGAIELTGVFDSGEQSKVELLVDETERLDLYDQIGNRNDILDEGYNNEVDITLYIIFSDEQDGIKYFRLP